MRIVFSTYGSLGDLHPYIALGREAARRGHRPLIATFAEYRDAVEAEGIEFAAMRPDMAQFGDKTAIMERIVDPWRGPEFLIRNMFMPFLRESYQDLERAARGADLLVTHPLTLAGPLLAQKQGLRWVSTALSPLTMFSDIDPPLFPAAPWMQWARALVRAVAGDPARSPFVQTTNGRKIRVDLGRKMPYELDGGDRKKTERLKVDVEYHAIQVCVP